MLILEFSMTAVDCQHKDKPQVLTPTKVVPGDGDFEVAELPRVQWPVPKGVFDNRNSFMKNNLFFLMIYHW
jgi:hypothetical protein